MLNKADGSLILNTNRSQVPVGRSPLVILMSLSINMCSYGSVRSEEAITYSQVRNETFMGQMSQKLVMSNRIHRLQGNETFMGQMGHDQRRVKFAHKVEEILEDIEMRQSRNLDEAFQVDVNGLRKRLQIAVKKN
jgi:hypothetical protein